jgi:SAM-dependent MidA family methyltransferase
MPAKNLAADYADDADGKSEILREIRARGPMSFRRYMELCLYHPQWGYYTSGRNRFGREGDYFTSAQLGTIFAKVLARRFEQMRLELGTADFTVLEMGPGRGDFGRALQAAAPHLKYRGIEYGEAFPEKPFIGCIFCNEFFDALPVQVVSQGQEVFVIEKAGELAWSAGPPDRELCPDAALWMRRFAAALERGYVLTVDYGYRGREVERFTTGTLMTYRRHCAGEHVFADPGCRDITAHVDFDLLVSAGTEAGLVETAFESQSRYLMRLGEADQFAAVLSEPGAAGLLKNLLFGIGETMRVLEMRRR